ncbi:oxidation resistance protein 1 [Mortierella polycephala]|uniref:Oxidation resistance protein 1 n=1 Tax=Mortierella polycephala TaxID=41804 RepID=A0A9P6U2U7_9FUNG|nr:oxidation resistance protein 1 [Mortierella polycephala]
MIPRKAKQSVLSLVTTEQPKYGPARSTQSTVSGGDWGEPTTPGSTDHGVEPNSAASGQDPWMLVTGSGSSYISDMHNNNNNSSSNSSNINSANSRNSGFPSGISTPLLVREEQLNRLPTLQLLDRNEDTDPVLDLEVAHKIRLELPRRLRNATKWNLIYSSDQHGISMTTLFHRCKGKGPMILAIKDTTDAVFGAYVTEEFKPNLSYYGNGECFLWNVTTLATSPQPPASPAFEPSPLPSPSPFQLASTATTPDVGRSPSPSAPSSSSSSFGKANNSNDQGGDRRHDLFQAMNDRLNTGNVHIARSPSPLSFTTHQHLVGSSSSSPTLRPTTSTQDGQTPTGMTPGAMGLPHQSGGKRKKKQKVVQFWKWSGKNDYMILSEPGFIGLGGGDGKFGLWIHSDLERGHSSRCATFDNEPLAAACHRPLRAVSEHQSQSHGNMNASSLAAAITSMKKTGEEIRDRSRSSSPKDDREEFYCQTIEIWAMVL